MEVLSSGVARGALEVEVPRPSAIGRVAFRREAIVCGSASTGRISVVAWLDVETPLGVGDDIRGRKPWSRTYLTSPWTLPFSGAVHERYQDQAAARFVSSWPSPVGVA